MIRKDFDNVLIVEDMIPIGILTTKDVMRLTFNQNKSRLKLECRALYDFAYIYYC